MSLPTTDSDRVLRQRFGAFLRQRRDELGATQLDFAAALDWGYPAMVSQVERGQATLPPYTIRRYAELLKVDARAFADMYAYFNHPFVYAETHGLDPYEAEDLPKVVATYRKVPRHDGLSAAAGRN